MTRATSHFHSGSDAPAPYASVLLTHDERHLRRKLLTLDNGDDILVDFANAVALADGDLLKLEDGRTVQIRAANETLLRVTAGPKTSLNKLAWHLGNRHLPAQIEDEFILIQDDHVIRDMLTHLGAHMSEISAPFSPERGAYHSHSGGHDHSHSHD